VRVAPSKALEGRSLGDWDRARSRIVTLSVSLGNPGDGDSQTVERAVWIRQAEPLDASARPVVGVDADFVEPFTEGGDLHSVGSTIALAGVDVTDEALSEDHVPQWVERVFHRPVLNRCSRRDRSRCGHDDSRGRTRSEEESEPCKGAR